MDRGARYLALAGALSVVGGLVYMGIGFFHPFVVAWSLYAIFGGAAALAGALTLWGSTGRTGEDTEPPRP